MIVLEMSTGLDNIDLYDFDSFTILETKIEERLCTVEFNYNKQLSLIITSMLDHNELTRISTEELL